MDACAFSPPPLPPLLPDPITDVAPLLLSILTFFSHSIPKVLQVPRILTVAMFEEGSSEGEEAQQEAQLMAAEAQQSTVVAGSKSSSTRPPLPPPPSSSRTNSNSNAAPVGVGGTARRGSFAFWLVASASRALRGSGSGSGAGSASGSLGQLRPPQQLQSGARFISRSPSHTLSYSNIELGLGRAASGESVPELGPPRAETASAPNLRIDLDLATAGLPLRPDIMAEVLQSVAEARHADEDSDGGGGSGARGSWQRDDGQQAVQHRTSPAAPAAAPRKKLLVVGEARRSNESTGTSCGHDSGAGSPRVGSPMRPGSPMHPGSPCPVSGASSGPLPRPVLSSPRPHHSPLQRFTSLDVDRRSGSGPPQTKSSSSAQQLARLQDTGASRRRSDTPLPASVAGTPLAASLLQASRALSQSRSRSSTFASGSRPGPGTRASPSFPRDT